MSTKTTIKSVKSPSANIIPVLDCFIKGLVYSDIDLTTLRLKRGQQLTLVLDRANPVDPDAVAIYNGCTKLGFVPKDQVEAIHNLIAEYGPQVRFRCEVKQFAPQNQTHRMILVSVSAQLPAHYPALHDVGRVLASF